MAEPGGRQPCAEVAVQQEGELGEEWEPAVGQQFPNLATAQAQIQLWAKGKGFVVHKHANTLYCRKASGQLSQKQVQQSSQVPEDKRRQTKVRDQDCPFKVKFSRVKDQPDARQIHSFTLEHNHPPDEEAVAFSSELTVEMRAAVTRYGLSNVKPGLAVRMLKHQFKDVKWTSQKVKNLYNKYGNNPRTDCHDLVQELLETQRQDPRWFVAHKFDDDTGELQRLFWMSPAQIDLAIKNPWVWIHDNTYKCNKYGFALGLFCTISVGGHTMELAACLVDKEDTASYEWAYNCIKKAVGVHPCCLFTDADRAVHAAVRHVFGKHTHHFWCLWHIGENLWKKLQPKDPKNFDSFRRDFYRAQRQPDKDVFNRMWSDILKRYPLYRTYLAEDSGLHYVMRWALAWQVDVFVAGMTGTSRGEGLNRQQKRYLSRQSTLMKVAIQVKARVEEEKLILESDVRAMNRQTSYATRQQGTNTLVPRVMRDAADSIGIYGFNLMVKQILKSSAYVCRPLDQRPAPSVEPTFEQVVHLHMAAGHSLLDAAALAALEKNADDEDEFTRFESLENFMKQNVPGDNAGDNGLCPNRYSYSRGWCCHATILMLLCKRGRLFY